MKRNIIPVLLLCLVLLFSCSFPHFYNTPVAQNVPLADTSNEFTGLLAGSFGAVNGSFEGQAAYSFPANIAITAGFLAGGNSNNAGNYNDYSKVSYFEGALGYYRHLADIFIFELYGGYGQGKQEHVFAYRENTGWLTWTWKPDGQADITYSQMFIQPDIGIKYKWLEGAFSCRLSKLNYEDISFSGTTAHLAELNDLQANSKSWLLEPAFTFRAGTPTVKTQLQLVFSANLTDKNLLTEVFRVNFGLHFVLGGYQAQKNKVVSSSNPSPDGR
jgi:hypothetical protein